MRSQPFFRILLSLTIGLLPVAAVVAQETSELASSEAKVFLGDWTLAMDFQGNPIEMSLKIADVDGKVEATLASEYEPQPQVITNISLDGTSLSLNWSRDFNGQAMTMNMMLDRDAKGLVGTFGDEGGLFSAELTGTANGEVADIGELAELENVDNDGDGDEDGDRRRRRRRGPTQATLALDGNQIRVAYDGLKKDSDDYKKIESLGANEVFSYVGGRAIKLLTDASLKFGDQIVKQGNAAPNYPGVYSLWLKKTDSGWSLVFNEHADIWGTQRLAEADVAEAAIEESPSDTDEEKLKVELVEVGDGGLLRIAWGTHQWLAPFELAE